MIDRSEYDRSRAAALKRAGLCAKCKKPLGRLAYVCDACAAKRNAWARTCYQRKKDGEPRP